MYHSSGQGFIRSPAYESVNGKPTYQIGYLDIDKHSSITQGETVRYHYHINRGDLVGPQPLAVLEIEGHSTGAWSIGDIHGNAVFTGDVIVPVITKDMVDPLVDSGVTSLISDQLDPSYVDAALASVYSQGFDGLTFVSELGSIKNLLLGAAKSLRKLMMSTDPKDWAKLWLEGRYGWRTLYYDIVEIDSLMRDKLVPKLPVYTAKVGGTSSGSIERIIPLASHAWTADLIVSHSVNVSQRGSVATKIAPPEIRYNPLQTGWEILPFSFVIDWFFSVGTSLAAISAASVHSDYVAAHGYKATISTKASLSNFACTAGWQGTMTANLSCKTVLTNRNPASASFIPSLNVNLDVFKIVDLLAILKTKS